MYYSFISGLALILHLIINRGSFALLFSLRKKEEPAQNAALRYVSFLWASVLFYLSDIVWGLLYEHHDIPSLFPFIYFDSVLYFLFMLLTMLTWFRYIVAYLDRRGRRSKALVYFVWAVFALGIIYLIINRFYPFIFSINAENEYVMGAGRYIAFLLQIALYVFTSSYLLGIACRSDGGERIRYIAVGVTCIVMELFLALQIIDPSYPCYAMGLIIASCVIHSFVEAGEKREKEIYDHIASGLCAEYDAMYYVNINTGEYLKFSVGENYRALNVPVPGKDFFGETQANITKLVYPDDVDFARSMYIKEDMLKSLEGRNSYSFKYRVMVDGKPRYFLFTIMKANDNKHFVLCERDIDDNITSENQQKEKQKKQITFSQIAESLASNYDVIYYVDAATSEYICYKFNNIYGKLEVRTLGEDFFAESVKNAETLIHKSDRERVSDFLNKDKLISALEDRKAYSIDYRLVVDKKSRYFRMTVRKTGDGTHFIIGVENVDAEIKKERQQLKALNTEKELARRDELTGVKNKTAYGELEKSVQSNIDNGVDYLPFALVVCDVNDLKKINDSEGHVAGDEYLKAAAKILCDIFEHSPVFRVGGDEFVIFLRGNDYLDRENLMEKVFEQVRENIKTGSGPVLAVGMSEFIPGKDSLITEIFDRADRKMYENKRTIKSGK